MIRIGVSDCRAFVSNFASTYLNTDKKGQECYGVITDCDKCTSINIHKGMCGGML